MEDKNIPFQIQGTDCYFYDLDKDVEKVLIEKMVDEYREANGLPAINHNEHS
jgi:hypothetical protein